MKAETMRSTDILKVGYIERFFDVETMSSHTRYTYDLYPDGKIVFATFEKGMRKPIKKETVHKATVEDFSKLQKKINDCLNTACTLVQYDDDTCAEVRIQRPFGRKEIMDSGYGSEDTDLRSIIRNYIYGVGGIEW